MSRVTFKSTMPFAARVRTVSMVERATFVIFTLGATRYAAPVEAVERVLRPTGNSTLIYGARALSPVPLAERLGEPLAHTDPALIRILVTAVDDEWCAVPVDVVHEVATLDASSVKPVPADNPLADRSGVRATFSRHEHDVYVLDLARLLR